MKKDTNFKKLKNNHKIAKVKIILYLKFFKKYRVKINNCIENAKKAPLDKVKITKAKITQNKIILIFFCLKELINHIHIKTRKKPKTFGHANTPESLGIQSGPVR